MLANITCTAVLVMISALDAPVSLSHSDGARAARLVSAGEATGQAAPLSPGVRTREVAAAVAGMMALDVVSFGVFAVSARTFFGGMWDMTGSSPFMFPAFIALGVVPILWFAVTPLAAAVGALLGATGPPGERALLRSTLYAFGAHLASLLLLGMGSMAAEAAFPPGATTWPLLLPALALRWIVVGSAASYGLHTGRGLAPVPSPETAAELRQRRPATVWRVSPTDTPALDGRSASPSVPLLAVAF